MMHGCLSNCNSQEPMTRLHRVSPASLKGDEGWRLRDTYADLIKDIEK